MRRVMTRTALATITLFTTGVATATAVAQQPAMTPAPRIVAPRSAAPRTARGTTRARSWADATLGKLTVRQKAAQLVWPWILGDYVPEGSTEWARLMQLVLEQEVGGFIVSVGAPTEIAIKVNALQRLSRLPLLISADYETGVGFRSREAYFVPNAIPLGGATNFPFQMALGASRDSALAYELGRITAVEGRALGVHVAFSPVLDVNNNPDNPVIGARSIGEDAKLVARLGAALTRGIEEHGMIATGKHFPGHGDTDVNSHLALPTLLASRGRLDSLELVPFRAAIRAGLGAIMTYHGVVPALDSSGVPATLSPAILGGVLRHELAFRGLIITDAMDMVGVTQQFGAMEAVKRAVAAGADVLLMPTDTRGAIDAVVAGVKEGRYTVARLDSSVRRLLIVKHRLGLDRRRLVLVDSVHAIVGDSSHVAFAAKIAEAGLTLVRDSLGQVPLTRLREGRILSITVTPRADLAAGGAFTSTLRRGVSRLRSELLLSDVDAGAGAVDRLLAASDSADVVLVSSYVIQTSTTSSAAAPGGLRTLVQQLVRRGKQPVVLAFGNPYLLREIPDIGAYLVAWGGSSASQVAAARGLLGEAAITGRLPVSIPPVAPLGSGLTRALR